MRRRVGSAFDAFHAKYPWITVKGVANMNDDKILTAISSGTPPDALLSFEPDNVGKFCSTGAWINLNDDIKKSKLDMNTFPKAALSYSGYKRAGGVHGAGSATLDSAFRTALAASCPAAIPVALAAPPAIGAALLALERITVVDGDLHDRLLGEVAASIAP